MKRIIAIIALVTISASTMAGTAGTYTCSDKVKNVVTAGGQKFTSTAYQTDQLILNQDGSMVMINLAFPDRPAGGTWSQSGNKVYLNPNYADLARNAEYGCAVAGATCRFLGVTYSYKMTIDKNQTAMKGSNKINLTMLVNGELRTNNATLTTNCRK